MQYSNKTTRGYQQSRYTLRRKLIETPGSDSPLQSELPPADLELRRHVDDNAHAVRAVAEEGLGHVAATALGLLRHRVHFDLTQQL